MNKERVITILFIGLCISCFVLGATGYMAYEAFVREPCLGNVPGPQSWVNHSKISAVYDIHGRDYSLYLKDVPQLHTSEGVGTNSMAPSTNGVSLYLYFKPSDEDIANIQIGDIIIYDSSESDIPVSHRIVEKYVADGCFLFRAKGDNNHVVDNEVITPNMIKGVVVGVIY